MHMARLDNTSRVHVRRVRGGSRSTALQGLIPTQRYPGPGENVGAESELQRSCSLGPYEVEQRVPGPRAGIRPEPKVPIFSLILTREQVFRAGSGPSDDNGWQYASHDRSLPCGASSSGHGPVALCGGTVAQ